MLQSGGIIATPRTIWSGNVTGGDSTFGLAPETFAHASYAELYDRHVYVASAVDLLADSLARLPFKTYERTDEGRLLDTWSPYAQLLAKPHPWLNRTYLWRWVEATSEIYGEALLLKQRDSGGTPTSLHPVHPTRVAKVEERDGRLVYTLLLRQRGLSLENSPPLEYDQSDIVHFRHFNPRSLVRGRSPLERLRLTLENEDNARRAQSAFWKNGARPGMALVSPNKLSDDGAERMKVRWDLAVSGVGKTGSTVVLEEGLEPKVMQLTAEEAQYIEGRKLNREEVATAYRIPAAAIGILDHATYSNITQQLRALYRDTVAIQLVMFEAVLEFDLRASMRPGAAEPDFGSAFYCEFVLDGVLRGDWESRVASYQSGVVSGWLMPSEVREMENLTPVKGADKLYMQGAMEAISGGDDDQESILAMAQDVGTAVQRMGLGVQYGVITADEARQYLGLPPKPSADDPPPQPAATEEAPDEGASSRGLTTEQVRSMMGRIGRAKSLTDILPQYLAQGLEPHQVDQVVQAWQDAIDSGEDVATFKTRLKALGS